MADWHDTLADYKNDLCDKDISPFGEHGEILPFAELEYVVSCAYFRDLRLDAYVRANEKGISVDAAQAELEQEAGFDFRHLAVARSRKRLIQAGYLPTNHEGFEWKRNRYGFVQVPDGYDPFTHPEKTYPPQSIPDRSIINRLHQIDDAAKTIWEE